jgi:hypothetical protein
MYNVLQTFSQYLLLKSTGDCGGALIRIVGGLQVEGLGTGRDNKVMGCLTTIVSLLLDKNR